jgi:sRNA-binding protein
VKAASQQRRTLSFKEGLLEIKKSMGKGTGPTPEEQQQAPQDKPVRKGPPAQARDGRSKEKDGRPRARAQQPGGRTHGEKGEKGDRREQPKQGQGHGQGQTRGQKPGERPAQHRQRPPRAPAKPVENLSDAEKARIERNRQLNTVWNVFAKHYPAFRDRLPLKIGVAEDLVARHPEYERTLIVAVLKRHVNHPRYHEHVAAGGSRFELDGSPSAGPGIDPSHIGRANAALMRQKAKAEARAQEKEGGKAQATQAQSAPAQQPQDAQAQVAQPQDAQPQAAQAPADQQPEQQQADAPVPASAPEGAEPPATGA